ncbi:uncharacterized protein TRAVEDRAFT_168163 [Trametes versicolor FP-101664 SS1]|uniref:uncharacterized protein n=1 Tax=Trametes versicolor (strain FP-101664) TaxID=717944 RepID=UPI0004622F6A|nr:uncharacterized protein TRAVEDRAFT_168163 [Trametes versicolor FP-101664 SS1]EIW58568.1 hypothetical protein TRAVEDRAFT_168163 [Trametes versicolor FP-101664 SS1]
MISRIVSKWNPRRAGNEDGLSLTPRRKRGNHTARLANERICFDPSLSTDIPVAESLRVFVPGGPADPVPALRPAPPFQVQQEEVDVVFPSCPALEDALLKLSAVYWRCECTLSNFLDFAKTYVSQTALESEVVALGPAGATDEDVWSLDSRGILTLVVGKETYEVLGLVGEALPWKEHAEMHVIHVSLRGSRPAADSMKTWLAYGPKEVAAIRRWDSHRGPWKVLYYCDRVDVAMSGAIRHEMSRTIRKFDRVRIPDVRRDVILSHANDAADEWEENISALFEWAGMASLGSPRISANDRCDPYIAVYAPPEPSRVGDVTVIRWNGFIPSSFIQQVLENISSPNLPPPNFVAVTGQCIGTSPVSYLPSEPSKAPPLRAPRPDAEDTWSLLYVKEDAGSAWVLAESVGQWDKRWG